MKSIQNYQESNANVEGTGIGWCYIWKKKHVLSVLFGPSCLNNPPPPKKKKKKKEKKKCEKKEKNFKKKNLMFFFKLKNEK